MVGYRGTVAGFAALQHVDIYNYVGLDPFQSYTREQIKAAWRRVTILIHPDRANSSAIPPHANLDQQYIGPITELVRDYDACWPDVARHAKKHWHSTWNPNVEPSDPSHWQPIPEYTARFRNPSPPARAGPSTATGSGAAADDPIDLDSDEPTVYIISDDDDDDDSNAGGTGRSSRRPAGSRRGGATPRSSRARPSGAGAETGRESIANLLDLAGASAGQPNAPNAVVVAVVRGQAGSPSDNLIPRYCVIASIDAAGRLNFRIANIDLDGNVLAPFGGGRASSIAYDKIDRPPFSGRFVGRFVYMDRDGVKKWLLAKGNGV